MRPAVGAMHACYVLALTASSFCCYSCVQESTSRHGVAGDLASQPATATATAQLCLPSHCQGSHTAGISGCIDSKFKSRCSLVGNLVVLEQAPHLFLAFVPSPADTKRALVYMQMVCLETRQDLLVQV